MPWRHLHRLDRIFVSQPMYYVTTCTHERRPILTLPHIKDILLAEWREAKPRHGWLIGRYVIMPDHVHFFCCEAAEGAKRTLSVFMNQWKAWTAKRIIVATGAAAPVWQREFFDRVLRTNESYAEKWEYVRQNPAEAKLVARPEDWPHAGHIDFDSPLGDG
jgi:putative transposase